MVEPLLKQSTLLENGLQPGGELGLATGVIHGLDPGAGDHVLEQFLNAVQLRLDRGRSQFLDRPRSQLLLELPVRGLLRLRLEPELPLPGCKTLARGDERRLRPLEPPVGLAGLRLRLAPSRLKFQDLGAVRLMAAASSSRRVASWSP